MTQTPTQTSPLRTYFPDTPQAHCYQQMHLHQTYDFVLAKKAEYQPLQKTQMTMSQALTLMDSFIDPSDPDLPDLPNSIHAYQTAERIRHDHPEDQAFQLCGLIHDLGKVLFTYGEPAWAVVGDTFPVGCRFADSIIYSDSFTQNPDSKHLVYSTQYGVYRPGIGLDQVHLSFGHDEYLYLVLTGETNQGHHFFPDRWAQAIRYHSFYPWHTNGDYRDLMKKGDKVEESGDEQILVDVQLLNQYDLYSKEDRDFQLTSEIKAYYQQLLTEYFPVALAW